MHDESRAWVEAVVLLFGPFASVLDLGGRDVNGTYRDMHGLAGASYFAIDKTDGPGVDLVADVAAEGRWPHPRRFDLVICTNVFEHEPRWRDIIGYARSALAPDGVFVCTMPGPAFPPHCDDGAALVDGVFYEAGDPDTLQAAIAAANLETLCLWRDPLLMDTGAVARHPCR